MKRDTRMFVSLWLVATVITISACTSDTNNVVVTTPSPTASEPVAPEAVMDFKLIATKEPDGRITVQPDDSENVFLGTDHGFSYELSGNIYNSFQITYRKLNRFTKVLASVDPKSLKVTTLGKQTLHGRNNPAYLSFASSPNFVGKLDDNHLLYVEPEVIDKTVNYHISTLDVRTGELKRIRENIWTEMIAKDYFVKHEWNAELGKLFLQSYNGTIWIFNLKDSNDQIHNNKFRAGLNSLDGLEVPIYSYPTLFLSPKMNRFVHDDYSGFLTFYTDKAEKLQSVKLPEENIIPSEKIKWSPNGTVAWLESTDQKINYQDLFGNGPDNIRLITPQRIDFFNPDGFPIGSIEAEKDRSVEVAGWLDDGTAVMKEYTPWKSNEVRESDEEYYTYEITSGKRKPHNKTATEENEGNLLEHYTIEKGTSGLVR